MESQFGVMKDHLDVIKAPSNVITPILVGCVEYTINDSSRRQTGFIFQIGTLDPQKNTPIMTTPIGKDVPANLLLVKKFPLGGDFAN